MFSKVRPMCQPVTVVWDGIGGFEQGRFVCFSLIFSGGSMVYTVLLKEVAIIFLVHCIFDLNLPLIWFLVLLFQVCSKGNSQHFALAAAGRDPGSSPFRRWPHGWLGAPCCGISIWWWWNAWACCRFGLVWSCLLPAHSSWQRPLCGGSGRPC